MSPRNFEEDGPCMYYQFIFHITQTATSVLHYLQHFKVETLKGLHQDFSITTVSVMLRQSYRRSCCFLIRYFFNFPLIYLITIFVVLLHSKSSARMPLHAYKCLSPVLVARPCLAFPLMRLRLQRFKASGKISLQVQGVT